MALSHPDILLEGGSDGGVNGTPDELALPRNVWVSLQVLNAPLRMATYWEDPKALHLDRCQIRQCEGSTVSGPRAVHSSAWQDKEKAAEYIKAHL